MKKWVIRQGKCIVIIFIILVIIAIIGIFEYMAGKRIHTKLHGRVDDHEYRIKGLEDGRF